jgi:hypothetical protein
MVTNTQNTHLLDHLPIEKPSLPVVQQPVKHRQPLDQKRPTKLLVLIGSLVVVIVLVSIRSGVYFAQQDSRMQQTSIFPTALATSSPSPVQFVSPIAQSTLLVPDLTALLTLLNSDDPDTQERGLAPVMKVGPSGTPGLLPARSKLEVRPETWTVINVDEKNEPYVAWIQAFVTVPGEKELQKYDLHLINVKGQWLLYNTTKR